MSPLAGSPGRSDLMSGDRVPRTARLTSTPSRQGSTRLTFCSKTPSLITEGSFWGHGRHKDHSSIGNAWNYIHFFSALIDEPI